MIDGECLTSSRGERKPQTRNTFQKIPACDGIRFLKAETSQYAELLAHREFVLGARRRLESCVHSFERPADNRRCKRLLDDLSQFIEVAGQRLQSLLVLRVACRQRSNLTEFTLGRAQRVASARNAACRNDFLHQSSFCSGEQPPARAMWTSTSRVWVTSSVLSR